MELMPGTTLQDLVEGRTAQRREGIARILDVIDGLREIHRLGIVHRDVKPSNCLMDSDGRAKIGDFGLSRSLVRADALTRTGTFIARRCSPRRSRSRPKRSAHAQMCTRWRDAVLFADRAGAVPGGRYGSDPCAVRQRPRAADAFGAKGPARRPRPGGLARSGTRPAKRWRDLGEFETALLPFCRAGCRSAASACASGAFAIDYALLFLLAMPFMLTLLSEAAARQAGKCRSAQSGRFFRCWSGRSSGCCISSAARPCGLHARQALAGPARVQAARRERPGLVNAVLRTGLFYLL